jgi:hypothetical protein
MSELNNNIDFDSQEPERRYIPISQFKIDWSMMLYDSVDEKEETIDWNKMVYGEQQLAQFDLQKSEKTMKPEFYEYLFRKPSERTEQEKYFLGQSGFDAEDDESEDEEEKLIKRLVIGPAQKSNEYVVEFPR